MMCLLFYSHDVHDPILFCFFFCFPLPFAKTHGRISQIWWSKCKCLMSLKVRMVASLSPVHLIPASGTILKPQQAWPHRPVFIEPAPEQHIRTTASKALPSSCSFVVFFICLFFNVLSPFLFLIWFEVSVNSFVSVFLLLAIF